MIGPPGTSYNKGVYLLSVKIPYNYPTSAPIIRFKTPIFHCNVSGGGMGRVCGGDEVTSLWSATKTIIIAL